jgi:GNAT superfamily N-acetyltransferase
MADPAITYRRATPADAGRAFQVFRTALNDYLARAGQELLPDENDQDPAFFHTLRYDGERCWVAEREGDMVAWGSAIVRDDWWFLSALFVLPKAQGVGVGAGLLKRARAGAPSGGVSVTVTDTLQPVSNTLYARRGMLPREALLGFAGPPRPGPAAGETSPPLGTLVPEPLTAAAVPDLRRLDLAVLGFDRTVDHRFYLGEGRRRGWLFRRAGRPVAYALYRPATGWIGPLASLRAADIAPVLRFVLAELAALGLEKVEAGVPAPCAGAQRVLWDAGLLFDGTPGLLLASRPFGRLDRYLPASYGMF